MNSASTPPVGRAQRLGRRLPGPIRAVLSRPGRRSRDAPAARPDPRPTDPVLSVVVVVTDGSADLAACLDSLRDQTLTDLEVIVVGGSPEAHRLASALVVPDERVRLVGPYAGRAAALNAGAADARGEFLAFPTADVQIPRTAYAEMVESLLESGSDFVSGAVQVVRADGRGRPVGAVDVHRYDRLAETLAEFPEALQETDLDNRVFRTSFWREVAEFADDEPAADQLLAVQASLRARTFDCLSLVTCHRSSARSRPKPEKPRPEVRLHRLLKTWRLVRTAEPRVAGAWLGTAIDGALADLLLRALDPEFRTRLRSAAQECLAGADEHTWPRVRLDRKLRLWLAAEGRWAELERLAYHLQLFGPIPATTVTDGRIMALADQLPGVDGAPADCLELGERQTALTGCIERLAWQGDHLHLDGWAFIPGVNLHGQTPTLSASLVSTDFGDSQPCAVTMISRSAANRWSMHRYQDLAPGGFTIVIDTGPLAGAPARWDLMITMQAQGIERTGSIDAVIADGAARLMVARDIASTSEPARVVPKFDAERGFGLQVRRDRVRAGDLRIEDSGQVSGTLRSLHPRRDRWVAVTATAGSNSVRAELGPPEGNGEQEFALPLPLATGVAANWKVRALDARDRAHRISWPAEGEQGRRVDGPGGVVWRRSPGGWVELGTGQRVVDVLEVQVGDSDLSVDVLLRGLPAADADLAQLVSPLVAVPAHRVETLDGGRLRLTLPLHVSQWGGPDLPLPSGDYQLEFGALLATWADPAATRLPVDGLTGSHRFRLGGTGAGLTFRLSLSGPRPDDEVGRWPQTQLGDWYAATDFAPTESVLFQSYRGEFVTDSPLEVHAELVRRHTPLELLWGVTDLSVPVPEGGRALLIESRDWYAALGRSRYLCRNIDVERYFRRRPGQRYLQTFHGYPFKSMGASLWRTQGRSETAIEVERVRRSSAWDAIVVPEDFCVEYYRQEYGYTGPALVTGYPRNDLLSTADPGAVRHQVLNRLGLDPDQILVLYAPTWRDTSATSAWTAKLYDGLELEALAAHLGDRYLVLVRGHNYNLREGLGPLPSAVRDVSAYPEINDLILAADVAVLDYSSLRFDWMITEKPVLFFVPDLEEYLESRTVLFDYPPTAPGPWLDSTRAVGDALLDLPGVTARYAAARKKFNERFNRRHDGYATKRVVDAFFA